MHVELKDVLHIVDTVSSDKGIRRKCKAIRKRLKELPVVEMKHGKWKLDSEVHRMFDDVDEDFYIECPFCNRRYWIPFELEEEKMLEYAEKEYPYCHCGAKLDGEEGAEQ